MGNTPTDKLPSSMSAEEAKDLHHTISLAHRLIAREIQSGNTYIANSWSVQDCCRLTTLCEAIQPSA